MITTLRGLPRCPLWEKPHVLRCSREFWCLSQSPVFSLDTVVDGGGGGASERFGTAPSMIKPCRRSMRRVTSTRRLLPLPCIRGVAQLWGEGRRWALGGRPGPGTLRLRLARPVDRLDRRCQRRMASRLVIIRSGIRPAMAVVDPVVSFEQIGCVLSYRAPTPSRSYSRESMPCGPSRHVGRRSRGSVWDHTSCSFWQDEAPLLATCLASLRGKKPPGSVGVAPS